MLHAFVVVVMFNISVALLLLYFNYFRLHKNLFLHNQFEFDSKSLIKQQQQNLLIIPKATWASLENNLI